MGSHAAYDGVLLIAVPTPCTHKLLATQFPCIYYHELVCASASQDIGGLAVEIGHAYLVAVLTYEVAVAVVALGPVYSGYLAACHTVPHAEVFFATVDASLVVALSGLGGCLEGHFGLSVTIEVVGNKG